VATINAPYGELVQLALAPYVISSTELRSALASVYQVNNQIDKAQTNMINEFIPAAVVQYINAHQLYQPNQ
jgi:nicotinic acid mononucleotide adenylyltransferase